QAEAGDPVSQMLISLDALEARGEGVEIPDGVGALFGGSVLRREIAIVALHGQAITRAAFSPDGKRVVTASEDKTAAGWHAETGGLIAELRGHADAVNGAAFSPDGTRVATASKDGTARIWDAETGALKAALRGHADAVTSVAFSSD